MDQYLQRLLLAGVLGLTIAKKAAALLDGAPCRPAADGVVPGAAGDGVPAADAVTLADIRDGAVLRAILDAASECLGHSGDRPGPERRRDALVHVLDLAAFAAELG